MIRYLRLYDEPEAERVDTYGEDIERSGKPIVADVSYRSKISYAIARTVVFLREGIGVSRRSITKEEGYTPYIHSYKTLERYVGIINHFRDTVLADVRRINQISTRHIDTHFANLLDKGGREKTVKVNASALIKMFNALSRHDLMKYIDDNRAGWVEKAMPSHRTNPFNDPDMVIDTIEGDAYKAAAVIQCETGARVSDIKKVVNSVLIEPKGTSVFIVKSKGGRNRILDFSDRKDRLQLVIVAAMTIKGYMDDTGTDWSTFQKIYTYEVRRAVNKLKEIEVDYCGTHAFRANYANRRYDEFDQKVGTKEEEDEILKRITEDMGHGRISMAKYYITAFRE